MSINKWYSKRNHAQDCNAILNLQEGNIDKISDQLRFPSILSALYQRKDAVLKAVEAGMEMSKAFQKYTCM